ncbi:Hypothetical protein MBVG_1010 [Mycoplasmopsis bovigenitalium 51080]|uniref:Uncharacterized protein n=1 Tax=Mycoplasmopsis bovigenitalium 51080 TaxID=1188235 RepID=N9TW20_9BACT|nr:hypothetical protein [Mycoplasmopsis bovigenitalium]ENY70230.1 Hypothetical protein MBVG_1010 [Mycoplasmopsis bovigenitalium 51080]
MVGITVSSGYNQSYTVSGDAICQLISQCASDTNFLKLDAEPKIIYNKDYSNASFIIDVKVKKNKNIAEIIENFATEFETRFKSLIDIKPHDIRVCYVGSY